MCKGENIMKNLMSYNFKLKDDGLIKTVGETVKYEAVFEKLSILDGEGLLVRDYVAKGEEKVETEDYLVLTYKSIGIYRKKVQIIGVIFGVIGDEEEPLVCQHDLVFDGNTYTVAVPTNGKTYDYLKLELDSRQKKMEFEIVDLYTCKESELPKRLVGPTAADGYKIVDLGGNFNDTLPVVPATANLGAVGEKDKNIPFALEDKIVRPPVGPDKENAEIIDNFTQMAERKLCQPISRASAITIDLNDTAKEVYFALYVDKFNYERYGFGTPGGHVILGTAGCEILKPLLVNDIERFAVLVNYEDGTVDECLPTNVRTMRHEIVGETGVYGVKVYDKKIKSITFETRMLDTDVSLAALTLNKDAECVLPAMFPERVKTAEKKFNKAANVSLDGDVLTLENGGFVLELDTKDGLRVLKAASAYSDTFKISGALLKVRDNGKVVEKFVRKSITVDDEAKIVYGYKNFEIAVFFAPTEKDGFKLSMDLKNKGDEEASVGVIFPAISSIEYKSYKDTWYFLPKYQNKESNGDCYVYEESAPSYPMQFMDIFSPTEGAGFGITTRERDLKVRKYALVKENGNTECYVEYSGLYIKLTPGSIFKGTETTMFVHEGDWHESYNRYKKWLNSWYEPFNCQDKMWYRKLFWLCAEIRDFMERYDFTKNVIWYNPDTKEYNFQYVMDEMTRVHGVTPDILHLWGWTKTDKDQGTMRWGNFGDSDFERMGGLENFRGALNDVHDKTGAEISLYVHPTLLTDEYPQFKEFYPEYCVETEVGKHITCGPHAYRMCHAEPEWRNHVLKMYQHLYKSMKTKIFYVDEFSLRVDNRCFNKNHKHEYPSNLLKTDRYFITALKDVTPNDLILYGEYYAADVNARYIDCNISYYILDSINELIEQGSHCENGSDEYGRVMTDIYRFAFPKIVQLILPMALRKLSWQPMKATFFNAEAIYDSFWDTDETKGKEYLAKAFKIKKEYGDCYASDTPETMVDAPSDAVCVNIFPGENRTIYNLYNRSYHTYMGEVIKVPYKEGAKFYDVWNEKDLEFTVRDGFAYVKATVTAQNTGCILETY